LKGRTYDTKHSTLVIEYILEESGGVEGGVDESIYK
jgi:hypothetical protein